MNSKSNLKRNLLMFARAALIAMILVAVAPLLKVEAQERITVEQVLARHLASIGTDEARQKTTSHLILGTCRAVFRGRGEGILEGRAVLASENTRNLLGIKFESPDYPHEKVGFDGTNFRVGYIRPGVRSTFGSFLLIHDTLFKEGLFGGTLSSAWPLLNLSTRSARLEYAGTDKIENRKVHKIRYTPRRGSDLQITLYFDAANFRHVRTQYERVVAPSIGGGVDATAGRRETRYRLVEDFSDFHTKQQLTLPQKYALELFIETTNGSVSQRYEFVFNQFSFNQEIGTEFFNAEAS